MSPGAPANHSNLPYQIPADAYYHLVHTLRLALPPPLTGNPEDLVRRDHAAIARIAALNPANAAEAELAAQFVAASDQWKDCLRLAQLPETVPDGVPAKSVDFAGCPEWAAKCRAQAHGMMRQANSALRLLLRIQDGRRKIEADSAACDRIAWTEHCALGLMAQALAPTPPAPRPEADMAEQAAAPEPGEANPGSTPGEAPANPGESPRGTEPTEAPPADRATAAEEYAFIYPERAAVIRRFGRLPDDAAFGPPDDDILQALVAGRSPASAACDRPLAQARAA